MEKVVKDISGYSGYAISNYGEVYSYWEGSGRGAVIGHSMKRLITSIDKNGREVVTLSRNKKRESKKVCRLVLLSFIGPPPKGMQCCHFPDRDPTNNRIDNLRWDTPLANCRDKRHHGYDNSGERNGSAKLSTQDVIDIRKRRQCGERYVAIANRYKVSVGNIQQICQWRTWTWLRTK